MHKHKMKKKKENNSNLSYNYDCEIYRFKEIKCRIKKKVVKRRRR